jgi:hypothetical protein
VILACLWCKWCLNTVCSNKEFNTRWMKRRLICLRRRRRRRWCSLGEVMNSPMYSLVISLFWISFLRIADHCLKISSVSPKAQAVLWGLSAIFLSHVTPLLRVSYGPQHPVLKRLSYNMWTLHVLWEQHNYICAWFEASAVKQMRTALFRVITQRLVEFFTDLSGQPIGLIFKGRFLILEDGTSRLTRNVGKKLPLLAEN